MEYIDSQEKDYSSISIINLYLKKILHFRNIVFGKILPVLEFNLIKKGKANVIVRGDAIGVSQEVFYKMLILNYNVSIKNDGEHHCIVPHPINGKLILCRRHDIKLGKNIPTDWINIGNVFDENMERFSAVPVSMSEPTHKHSIKCLDNGNLERIKILLPNHVSNGYIPLFFNLIELGTCSLELIGPNIQGNTENLDFNCFVIHGTFMINDFPKPEENDNPISLMDKYKAWFTIRNIEGVVISFDDGTMNKITKEMLKMYWVKRNESLINETYLKLNV